MKQTILIALAVLLVLVCVFCAIFSVCMAARPDTDNGGSADNADGTSDTDETPETPVLDGEAPEDTETPPDGEAGDGTSEDGGTETEPKKRVAITIDDGPYHVYQQKFVDEMAKYGGAATFFIVGQRVEWFNSTKTGLAYAVENGWEIGIHAWTHDHYFNNCDDETYNSEIQKTVNIIQKYVPGYDVKLLRPPGGYISSARAQESEYAIILWDVDSNDWRYKSTASDKKEQNVEAIVSNITADVRDGSIVLLHELYQNSFDAYCEVLRRLDEEGYEFVTVSELLGDKYQAGKKFYSGR